jgi:hypothetical protein
MKVRFHRQRPTGGEEIGVLVLREGRIVAEPPDSVALNNIVNDQVHLYGENGDRRRLDATLNPDEFLTALPAHYHGTYFWAVEERAGEKNMSETHRRTG